MPAAPKAAAAPTPTAAELQALVATLEDDAAREELVARLKALTAAAPPEDERGAIADAIDSINHEIGERVDTVGAALAGLADSVGQAPVLARWSWQQLTDPLSRGLWWSVGRQIGAAVLAGLLVSVLVRLLLRRWRDRSAALPLAARRSARLKASLAHLTVNLLALGTFLGVTHLALGYDDVSFLARRVAVDILVAIGCVRGLTAVSKAVLAPENPRRRLVGMDDATARETQRWLSLLLGLGFYGYFALAAGRRLGLPWAVHGFLLHALFLVVTVLVVTVIYRLRAHLGAAIEQWGQEGSSANIARYLPWQAFAAVGHHVLAVWAGLVFLVWAVGAPDGAWLLTRGLIVTAAMLVAVRALDVWLDWTFGGRREPAPSLARPATGTRSRRRRSSRGPRRTSRLSPRSGSSPCSWRCWRWSRRGGSTWPAGPGPTPAARCSSPSAASPRSPRSSWPPPGSSSAWPRVTSAPRTAPAI